AVQVSGGRFERNTCTNAGCEGAGLAANGLITISGTQFVTNTSGLAGAAAGFGPIEATNSLFQANSCRDSGCLGAGVYAAGVLTLTHTDFISNTAITAAGGAVGLGAVTVTGGRFERNVCTGTTCAGGALAANTSVVISGTQFLTNSSGFE